MLTLPFIPLPLPPDDENYLSRRNPVVSIESHYSVERSHWWSRCGCGYSISHDKGTTPLHRQARKTAAHKRRSPPIFALTIAHDNIDKFTTHDKPTTSIAPLYQPPKQYHDGTPTLPPLSPCALGNSILRGAGN